MNDGITVAWGRSNNFLFYFCISLKTISIPLNWPHFSSLFLPILPLCPATRVYISSSTPTPLHWKWLCGSDLVVGAQGLLPVFSTNPESHKFGSAVAQQTAGSVLPILLFRISPETISSEQAYFLARLIVSLRRHFFFFKPFHPGVSWFSGAFYSYF